MWRGLKPLPAEISRKKSQKAQKEKMSMSTEKHHLFYCFASFVPFCGYEKN